MLEFFSLCRSEESEKKEYCIIDISCISVCVLLIFFSVFALYKMCRYYRRIKFENLVISGGIIELILIILSVLTNYEIVLEISNLFQIFISLYIIRRLVRIVRKQFLKANVFGITKEEPQFDITKYIEEDNEERQSERIPTVSSTLVNQRLQKDKLHNALFISLSVVNVLLFVVNVICMFIKKNYYIDLTMSIYALGVSVLLVVLGVIVISKMKKANDQMKNIKEENVISPLHSEQFFQFRKLQLFIVIFTYLFSTGYQLFFFFGKSSFFPQDILTQDNLKIYPQSKFGFVLILCVEISNIMIVSANLFSFYCLIYKQYQTPKDIDVRKIFFSNDEIEKSTDNLVNNDIMDFLKKSNAKKEDRPTESSSFSNAKCNNS